MNVIPSTTRFADPRSDGRRHHDVVDLRPAVHALASSDKLQGARAA